MKALHACLTQLLSAAIALSLLQSVATRQFGSGVASRPVPVERIRWTPALAADEPVATLHVIREARSLGRAKSALLTLDGCEVAEIRDGENLLLRLPSGPHMLGLRRGGQAAPPGAGPAHDSGAGFSAAVMQLAEGRYHDLRIVPAAGWSGLWQLDRSGV